MLGVTGHTIDIGSGSLEISLSPTVRPSLAELAGAIREAGFTLLDVEVRT